VTAARPAPDTELTERLAEHAWGVLVAAMRMGVPDLSVVAHAIAGNLRPVVQEYADQRAADELEAAADDPDLAHVVEVLVSGHRLPHRVVAAADLYNRAAALRTDTDRSKP
jgi:hypothetical protein